MTESTPQRRKKRLASVLLLVMTVINLLSALRLMPFLAAGYQNFTIFYTAGRIVRNGQMPLLYDLGLQYRIQQQIAPNVAIRHGALPYNHPPFEALLFVPLTFLPYFSAFAVWTALNFVILAVSLIILRKTCSEIGDQSLLLSVLAVTAFAPITDGIVQGHDSILLLFLFTVALAMVEEGRQASAGVALALGLFKFQLMIPFVFLLVLRRRRILIGFLPTAAVLALVSLWMIGWRGLAGYSSFLLRLDETGAGGAIVGRDMPNLRGIVSVLTGMAQGRSLLLLTLACSAALALMAWRQMRAADDSTRVLVVLATVVAILVSYHTLTYDLSLLLPAVLLLFGTQASDAREALSDLALLSSLYLTTLFDHAWPHLEQFCWPLLMLFWTFLKRKHWLRNSWQSRLRSAQPV